ncbi:hypothetical protein CR513_33561, partial [Mucuna pruriens]
MRFCGNNFARDIDDRKITTIFFDYALLGTLKASHCYTFYLTRYFMNKANKHTDTRYHFIRECIVKKEVELVHVKIQDQVVDIFTKTLKFEDFKRLRK